MAVNLSSAILQQLRGSQAAQAFGDTWNPQTQTGVQKFFADFAPQPLPVLPYLVLIQPGGNRDYLTASAGGYVPYIETGQVAVRVYHDDRDLAEQLGDLVVASLNDAPLSWPRCNNFMLLRAGQPSFIPNPDIGPGSPTVFLRLITFNYQWQGAD